MKQIILLILCLFALRAFPQSLQLHYDLRHTVSPKTNPQNFPTLFFEYFKAQTDTTSFIKPVAFLFKMEADLQGSKNNIGKAYIQTSQSFRFWKPKVFLSVQYSGGLGVTEPKQYSYYIGNSLGIGPGYSFQWRGAYFTAMLYYTRNFLSKPGNDVMASFYWWKGLFNYKMEFAGDFELYTLNRNQGDELTRNLKGKMVSFFGEPQVWFNLNKSFALGSKQLLYYHVTTTANVFRIYPSAAVRVKL